MDKNIDAWLFDIHKAIDEIELFLENKPKDFFKYREDLLFR